MTSRLGSAFLLGALCVLPSCGLLRFAWGADYSASPYFHEPPLAWKQASELRVVTFNIKDMYWLSDDRAPRMAAIGKALADLRPDIVCIQEGFVAGDVSTIEQALRGIGIEHVVDYPSGVVGSGMWTFSRFPIRETFFLRYSKNGSVFDTRGGDWWAGKGVGLARVEIAPGRLLDVYNTHMICGLGPAELRAHRHTQVREFAGFVNSATPAGVPVLLLGDFNCGPSSREFRYLDRALMWQRMLKAGTGRDHIYAYSLYGAYRFTRLEESTIHGRVPVDGKTVSLSDHRGLLVRLRIEPGAVAGQRP